MADLGFRQPEASREESQTLSVAERDRRHDLLQGLVRELELDALVLAGADYRGHKGTLGWVADYNLAHRYGFAIAAPCRAPVLLLPFNLAMARPGGWGVEETFARDLRVGLPEALRAIGSTRRIGLVGQAQATRPGDPGSPSGRSARRCSSAPTRSAARIRSSSACIQRSPATARYGAASARRTTACSGRATARLLLRADRPARVLDRVRAHGRDRRADGTQVPMNRAVTAGLEAGAVEMRPDRHLDEVPPAILDAVAAHGARSSYMADTYLVTATGGEALSTKPLDVIS